MSISVLEIDKGALDISHSFDETLDELTSQREELLQNKAVREYLITCANISELKEKKREQLNAFYNGVRSKCDHPLYICVTDGYNSNYTYKCICLNCGLSRHFKQYELDELYKEHRLIARKEKEFLEDDTNYYYCTVQSFIDVANYYRACYSKAQNIGERLNDDLTTLAEASASEATFNHFVLGKSFGRQKVKKR